MSKQSIITQNALKPIGKEIAAGIKKDGLKFFSPFLSESMQNRPKNAVTGYEYNGINFWNLSFIQMENKFKQPLYASEKVWKQTGATIKPEFKKKGYPIFYWFKKKYTRSKLVDTTNLDNPDNFYYRQHLKITYGFNADQVDLTNSNWSYPKIKKAVNKVKENRDVFNFVDNQKGLVLKHSDQPKCYYAPELDYIHMTNKQNFVDTKNKTTASFEYYSTLLHELVHWTGHKSRTNRFKFNLNLFNEDKRKEYALEELIAEIGANLLCINFNMQKKVNDNSLAYLKSWIKALENDTVFIEKALSQSWLAIEYLNKNIVENTAKKTA